MRALCFPLALKEIILPPLKNDAMKRAVNPTPIKARIGLSRAYAKRNETNAPTNSTGNSVPINFKVIENHSHEIPF